jgi:hypothetical protein
VRQAYLWSGRTEQYESPPLRTSKCTCVTDGYSSSVTQGCHCSLLRRLHGIIIHGLRCRSNGSLEREGVRAGTTHARRGRRELPLPQGPQLRSHINSVGCVVSGVCRLDQHFPELRRPPGLEISDANRPRRDCFKLYLILRSLSAQPMSIPRTYERSLQR